jgi:hypothetical protein
MGFDDVINPNNGNTNSQQKNGIWKRNRYHADDDVEQIRF